VFQNVYYSLSSLH